MLFIEGKSKKMGSQQKIIKEKIIECLKAESGKEKTTEEIKNYLEEKEVHIDKGTGAIRNALFNLKQENPSVVNVKRGVYAWREKNEKKVSDLHKKYDFSDFITIANSKKREDKLMVSIFQDGTFALNTSLQKHLLKRTVEIRLKKDCSQLAIIKNGNESIDLGKNGRIKNYDILKKLKEHNKKFPAYYVGTWDEQEEIWIGNFLANNPNKKKNSKNKK